MHTGKLVFAQLTECLSSGVFAQCVARYAGSYPMRSFSHWDQLLCMMFAQLTSRASLRDITVCLQSHAPKLYHAGIRGTIARTTLADANEQRDCSIFRDFALHLIGIARPLYAHESLAVQLEQTVYAIDSSMIDLCLSLFAWAPGGEVTCGRESTHIAGPARQHSRLHSHYRGARVRRQLPGPFASGGGQFLRNGQGLCSLREVDQIHGCIRLLCGAQQRQSALPGRSRRASPTRLQHTAR